MTCKSLSTRSCWLAVICGVVVVSMLATSPVAAQEESITAEIVKMLEADLSEEIVLDWLEGRSTGVESLSADDLVTLKQAGASDDLMKRLLELGRGEDDGSESVASEVPSPAESPPSPESPPAEPSPSSSVSANEEALVTFGLSYLARVDEEEVGAVREWDLYVYLDGYPLTWMTSAEVENRPSEMEFLRAILPGPHTLRVVQERHYKRGGEWRHETRVAEEEFEFVLRPGATARVEVEFVQRLMDYQNPLLFKMTQGVEVLDSGRVGGQAEFWPALCEDIEASLPAGKKPNRQQRRQLEECVEWESLWDAGAPSRREVLDAMARFDFRPQPKGS